MKRARDSDKFVSSAKRQRTTAYTPYPLQPSDSPSNPFNPKTILDSLPPITSFRKHIPLRFQLHRTGVSFRKGGVYRIVQVPLNYTFTHLRALIAWLFHVHPNGKTGEDDYLFDVKTGITMENTRSKSGVIKSGETSIRVSNSKDPWRSRFSMDADDQDELEGEESEDENADDAAGDWIWADEENFTLGHVWTTGLQADRGIIYHHGLSTQLHITVNSTKLPRRRGKSNVPYVFSARGRVRLCPRPLPRPLFTHSVSHALSSSPAGPSSLHLHASRTRQNLNRKRIPSSPNPFDDDLSDTDANRQRSFERSHASRQTRKKSVLLDHEKRSRTSKVVVLVEDTDDEWQESEDEDELDEGHDLDPEYWNESHYAFGRYLLSFIDPRGRSYAHLEDEYFEEKKPYDPFENDDDDNDDDDETYVEEGSMEQYLDEMRENGWSGGIRSSTPELTSSSGSGRCSSSLPPSSPPAWLAYSSPPSSSSSIDPLSLSPDSSAELHPCIIASHYPNKKYTFTPAPPIARGHRLQLERLERRMARGKRGSYLCKYDEVEEEEEVDELFDDDDEEEEEDGIWVRPVLKEGEVWDPFGDESEV